MGQHTSYQKERVWFLLVICFQVGTLLVAAYLYRMVYYPPGIIGAHATRGFLGLGIVVMAAPIWAYFRKRKRGSRNPGCERVNQLAAVGFFWATLPLATTAAQLPLKSDAPQPKNRLRPTALS